MMVLGHLLVTRKLLTYGPALENDFNECWLGFEYSVVGASSGIGLATSREVANRGARVVMVSRSAEKLRQVSRDVAGQPVIVPVDMSIDTPMMKNVKVPKSSPDVVAQAVIGALRKGLQEVWAGEGAEEMRTQLQTDPAALFKAAATQLRLSDINATGRAVKP